MYIHNIEFGCYKKLETCSEYLCLMYTDVFWYKILCSCMYTYYNCNKCSELAFIEFSSYSSSRFIIYPTNVFLLYIYLTVTIVHTFNLAFSRSLPATSLALLAASNSSRKSLNCSVCIWMVDYANEQLIIHYTNFPFGLTIFPIHLFYPVKLPTQKH